ncbi:hypothetical protein VR611_13585, partial [Aquirufa nivalisilvae]
LTKVIPGILRQAWYPWNSFHYRTTYQLIVGCITIPILPLISQNFEKRFCPSISTNEFYHQNKDRITFTHFHRNQ